MNALTINVLQAMDLTDGEKMLLTPTYHVFEMHTVHHDATMLPVDLACDTYEFGDDAIPAVSASASKDAKGRIHVTLSNLDPSKAKAEHRQAQGVQRSEDRGGQTVRSLAGEVRRRIGAGLNSWPACNLCRTNRIQFLTSCLAQ